MRVVPSGGQLLTKAGERAELTADTLLALNEVLKDGKMPPPPKMRDGKPDHDIPGLTEPEVMSLLFDTRHFPRKR